MPALEGADLNPLLQNYWMTIHPPSLYIGLRQRVGAVRVRDRGAGDRPARRRVDPHDAALDALLVVLPLASATSSAPRWAYEVLGWGGYWAWDPVENAAFMPWLVVTAFLHSVMIQEKKDMLKVWNMVLVILTFSLTIFGTFLTRSGVISSVHSFTQSGLGPFFIGFLLFVHRWSPVGLAASTACRSCAARTSSSRSSRASRRSSSTT